MNYIQIAKETMQITADCCYDYNGTKVTLPSADYSVAEVWSPERSAALLTDIPDKETAQITVVNQDSFQAASAFEAPLVMNFANAYMPGGGFKMGSPAQEESLCRCSTLYSSLTSESASEMYRYNRRKPAQFESDHMIYSPDVCVFRDENCRLLAKPFTVSVITAPAPNRRGTAVLASEKNISEVFLRRIEILCKIAVYHECRTIVLGAWGCGAFGNDPVKVAEYFRTILIDKEYARCFDNICFAIYGSTESKNYTAFRNAFL